MNDLKFAFRQLLKNPGFTAVAVLTLALGIGANTAMFSFLNSLLLRPLPFPRSDELVRVFRGTPQIANGNLSPADFLDLQRGAVQVGHFAAYERSNDTLDDYERPTPWVRITPDLFPVLSVRPELGRAFRAEEAREGDNRVVLISHWLWRDRFGGTDDVIGQTLRSGGKLYEIVGVMPPAATDHRLFNQVGVFSPLALDGATRLDRTSHRLNVLGRRRGSVSAGQAEAFLTAFGARLATDYPTENVGTTWRSEGLPAADMSPTGRAILWMLLGLSGFVLLIACSNLANFLLARTIERCRELAVRAALGAARRQLLRPLVWEALTLSILGGAGALLVSQWTTNWLHTIIWNNGGPTIDFSLDSRVLLFDLAVSIATILFFGVGPAMLTLRIRANDALKSGARGGTPGRGQQQLIRWLIAGQFALAMVLLAGAGFFVRGAINVLDRDYGWSSKGVVQCDIGLPPDVYPDGEQITAFHQQLLDQVQHSPGVESASLSFGLPFLGLRPWTHYSVEGREASKGQEPQVFLNDITPDYFKVTGTRLLSGRPFSLADSASSPKVVIINETMARTFFPNANPIGKRVSPAGSDTPDWSEIVGVVADARSADVADKPVTYQLYKPMAQNPARAFVLAVRTDGAAVQPIMGALRFVVTGLDSKLQVRELMTADQMIARLTSQFDMVRHLLIAFAGLGLFLATIGIYGMIARTVVQRTGEIGIRMALGAQIGDVLRLILRSGLRVATVGAVLGLLGAVGLSRLLASVLPAMQTNPALVGLGASLLLLFMALAASWLPARRAARVDPMVALRCE
jgi:predicted permease